MKNFSVLLLLLFASSILAQQPESHTDTSTLAIEQDLSSTSETPTFSEGFLTKLLERGYRKPKPANRVKVGYLRSSSGFRVIDSQHVILRESQRKHFLISFASNCSNLNFDPVFYFRDRFPLKRNSFVHILDRPIWGLHHYRGWGRSHRFARDPFFHSPRSICRIADIHSVERLSFEERKQQRLKRKQKKLERKQKKLTQKT